MSFDSAGHTPSPVSGDSGVFRHIERADKALRSSLNSISTVQLIAALFILALGLRTAYALVVVDIDPILSGDPLMGDAASYDRIARSLMAGTGYGEQPNEPSAFWPPLYPAFLAGLYSVAGYELTIARLVNGLLGALVPVIIYLIGTRLFDNRVALLAAIGAALYPLFIVFGAWVIPDGPYILFVSLILLTMLEVQRRPRPVGYLALGVLLGLAYLLKPVTAFFLPFLIPWFLLSLTRLTAQQRWVAGLITASVLILVLAPWTIRNQAVLGSPIIGSSNGGYTFYGANNPDAWGGHYEHFPERIPELSEGEEQMLFYRKGVEWILSDPTQFLWVGAQKFRRLASPLSISSSREDLSVPGEMMIRFAYSVFLISAAAGMILLRHRWREMLLLLVPIFAVLLSTAVFYGDARYTMPAVPVLLLLSAVTIVAVWDRVVRIAPTESGVRG